MSLDSDTGSLNDGLTKWANPRIQGTGATPGATVQIREGSTLVGLGQADGAGNWQVQTVSLSEGTHSLTAVQVDGAGNSSAASSPLTIKVDTLVASLATPLLASADPVLVQAIRGLQEQHRFMERAWAHLRRVLLAVAPPASHPSTPAPAR